MGLEIGADLDCLSDEVGNVDGVKGLGLVGVGLDTLDFDLFDGSCDEFLENVDQREIGKED